MKKHDYEAALMPIESELSLRKSTKPALIALTTPELKAIRHALKVAAKLTSPISQAMYDKGTVKLMETASAECIWWKMRDELLRSVEDE